MRRTLITTLVFLALIVPVLVTVFTPAYAQTQQGGQSQFVPLLPDLPIQDASGGLEPFLNGIFALTIGIAAILAVIMIVVGGFRYMMTESPFTMGDAKGQIADALVGLLIVLASVLILRTINPDLVSLNVFRNAKNGSPSQQATPNNNQSGSPDFSFSREPVCSGSGSCTCPSQSGRTGFYNPSIGKCIYNAGQQSGGGVSNPTPPQTPQGPGGQDELPPPNPTSNPPTGSQQGAGGQDELPPPNAPPPPAQSSGSTRGPLNADGTCNTGGVRVPRGPGGDEECQYGS